MKGVQIIMKKNKNKKVSSREKELVKEFSLLSNDELLDTYWNYMNDVLGTRVDVMIERDYDPRDIRECRQYEKYCSDVVRAIEIIADKRDLKLYGKF